MTTGCVRRRRARHARRLTGFSLPRDATGWVLICAILGAACHKTPTVITAELPQPTRVDTPEVYPCNVSQECAGDTYCVDDGGDGVYLCRPGCESESDCANVRAQLPSMSCRRVESTDGDLSSSRVCKAQSPAIIQDQVTAIQENPATVHQGEPVPVIRSNAKISDMQFGAGSHSNEFGPRITGQVDLGDVELVGNEDKVTTASSLDVLAALARYKSQILYCYEKRLKQKPDLPPGVVVISVSISQGRAQSVTVSGNTTGDAELGDCIGKKFLLWQFDADTEIDVDVPYLLSR